MRHSKARASAATPGRRRARRPAPSPIRLPGLTRPQGRALLAAAAAAAMLLLTNGVPGVAAVTGAWSLPSPVRTNEQLVQARSAENVRPEAGRAVSGPIRPGAQPVSGAGPTPTPSIARARGVVGEVFRGSVTRIVDGDTFWTDAADVRIRIWGLDAPELRDPAGTASTEALRQILGQGTVTCRTRDIDRFGRIVGQCHLADGTDIAAAMIARGAAREFCRFSRNYYGTC